MYLSILWNLWISQPYWLNYAWIICMVKKSFDCGQFVNLWSKISVLTMVKTILTMQMIQALVLLCFDWLSHSKSSKIEFAIENKKLYIIGLWTYPKFSNCPKVHILIEDTKYRNAYCWVYEMNISRSKDMKSKCHISHIFWKITFLEK